MNILMTCCSKYLFRVHHKLINNISWRRYLIIVISKQRNNEQFYWDTTSHISIFRVKISKLVPSCKTDHQYSTHHHLEESFHHSYPSHHSVNISVHIYLVNWQIYQRDFQFSSQTLRLITAVRTINRILYPYYGQ